jgi:phenylpyruvate tautomerase PptA (4-oxalocrotonate tautomerase family)
MTTHDHTPTSRRGGAPRGTRGALRVLLTTTLTTAILLGLAVIGHAATLQVTKEGTGSGTVTASTSALNCGTSCTATVSDGTLLTLTARASAGSVFARWGGACASAGTATTCNVNAAATVALTAAFRQADIDFNGDGLADVAIHRHRQGDWFVGLSTGSSFDISRFAVSLGNRGHDRERILLGDFTGDGRTDVAIHDSATGDWFVGRSTGTGFVVERWATGFGNRGHDVEHVLVGDFDGDGRADLALHDRRTGDWFVGRSTGTSFAFSPWLTSFGNRGRGRESVFVGDFTGDGRSDLVIHDRPTGSWFVARSTGTAFTVETWATSFGNRGHGRELVYVGDFTGDGRTDIAIHDRVSGDWFVGRSTGSSFAIELWASSFGSRGNGRERVYVGDFSGDGRMDVAVHDRITGDWWVGTSTGSTFSVTLWVTGFGNRGEGRERAHIGDFTGDGRTDVAIHDFTSGDWFVGVSTGTSFVVQRFASNFGNGGEDDEEVATGRHEEQEMEDEDEAEVEDEPSDRRPDDRRQDDDRDDDNRRGRGDGGNSGRR